MQKEIIGREKISELKNVIFNSKRILIFRGKSSFNAVKDDITPLLKGHEIDYCTEFEPNPKYEEVQEAIKKYVPKNYDILIAIGGGSAIDFAKAYRYYSKKQIPLIAIPTTSGTGSEATQFSVIYIDGEKTSLDDISILPDYCVIEGEYCKDAPKYIKACCAMDAYCQAIESFWAKKATKESKKYAIEAIKLCKKCLIPSVLTNDLKANQDMAYAAHLSGKAINISRTTASHALSYKITTLYNVPHGHAVALTIANLFIKNLGYFDDENTLLDAIGIKKDDIKEYFHNLMTQIELKDNLKELGINDIECLINSVNIQRLQNNPRELNKDDLAEILGG